MEINNLTPEELLTKSISAAFDSVNLINEINLDVSPSEEQSDSKLRNQEHLNIMLGKDDFKNALTIEQEAQIIAVL